MAYVTDQDATVALRSAFARGSVGDLYEIIGEKDYVAKIYHKPLSQRAERKLRALIDLAPAELLDVAAWPLTSLRPASGEPVRGVVMRRIVGMQSLFELDSPSQRRLSFPRADWQFLVRAARKCAALVDAVHQTGVVLGDVQPGRFLIDEQGEMQVIDCDSCQIAVGDETFHCLSVTPQYRAPEMQNVALDAFPQTPNHDAFGLAVVIYRLLMMGRHPFVGYQGADRMAISRAIAEYRFALGSTASTLLMTPPPHNLQLSDLPADVAKYFQQAFSPGSQREGARPTPAQWVEALTAMERQLRVCAADPGHSHVSGLPCPWCRIEQEGGPAYFGTVTVAALETRPAPIDVRKSSLRLDAVPTPDKLLAEAMAGSDNSSLAGQPLPAGTRERQTAFYALSSVTLGAALLMLLGRLSINFLYIGLVLTIGFAVATVVAFLLSPLWQIRRQRGKVLAEKQSAWLTAERQAKARADRVVGEFAAHYKATVAVHDQLQSLQDEETRELRLLQAAARERQIEHFLAGYSLRAAKLEKLDEDRLLILQSHGVETARDIERTIGSIRGLGDTLPASLLTWRKALEGKFTYDDRRGLPAVDVARVRNKTLERRLQLQEPLEVDIDRLEAMAVRAHEEAAEIAAFLLPYRAALAQAKLDLKAAGWRKTDK